MLLWGERRKRGGDNPTAETQRGPCHPRNDPPIVGVSEPVLASFFPRKAAADAARCPSRGKVGVWVRVLSLPSSARALHRFPRCPLLLLSKHSILGAGPHGKPGSSPFPPSGCPDPGRPHLLCPHTPPAPRLRTATHNRAPPDASAQPEAAKGATRPEVSITPPGMQKSGLIQV